MYLNDLQRKDFYGSIGLDAKQFDQYVIRKTNQSAKSLFPVILDVDHPEFFPLLDKCSESNQKLIDLDNSKNFSFLKTLLKLPHYFTLLTTLIKLYFLKAIETNYIWTI